MAEKVTVAKIANECGVSSAAVSLVLNNKPGISEITRHQIIETALKMGYPVKPFGSKIPSRQLNTLGLVVKSDPSLLPPANPFYSRIIAGVDEACQQLGIHLLFAMLPVDGNNHPLKIPPFLESDLADGILVVGTFLDKTITPILNQRKVPIVLVDGYSDTEHYDMVVSDNFGAAYQAVEYLINLGHKQIGLVGGEPDCYPSLKERRNGYLRAMKEHVLPAYSANFNINISRGEEETIQLLKETPQITALFAINDNIALGAARAAQRLGIRIPEDLSIVGYDDTYLATSISPALTTMHVDTVAMGQGAVHLVSLRLNQPEAARITLTVHPTLVQRASVAVPRAE
jgi:LacI family transcriptional regulator